MPRQRRLRPLRIVGVEVEDLRRLRGGVREQVLLLERVVLVLHVAVADAVDDDEKTRTRDRAGS